ncbi:hypothetical protein FOZ63_013592, partial [Perkinsus olseni]
ITQSPSLTAVNGSKLATTGYVTLTFHRDDERTVEAACSSRLTSTPIASVAAVAVPPDPSGCIPAPYSRRLSRHVDVKEGTASDFDVDFDPSRGYWSFQWKWKGGVPPSGRIGSNVGEYTKTLTTDERMILKSMALSVVCFLLWVFLNPISPVVHLGQWPTVDCPDVLRSWRMAGRGDMATLVDLRKAYLQ